MSKYFRIIIASLFVCRSILLAQSRDNSIGVFVGIPFGSTNYSSVVRVSAPDIDARRITPVISIGIDANIYLFTHKGLQLFGLSEIGYSKIKPRGDIKIYFSSTEGGIVDGFIERIPILLGIKMKSESVLSPFLKFGAGISNTRYYHSIPNSRDYTFDINSWQFCWMSSAGLDYRFNETIDTEIFVKSWYTEDDLTKQISYDKIGIEGRYAIISFGIKTGLRF